MVNRVSALMRISKSHKIYNPENPKILIQTITAETRYSLFVGEVSEPCLLENKK